jgi:hypothetical protein
MVLAVAEPEEGRRVLSSLYGPLSPDEIWKNVFFYIKCISIYNLTFLIHI